MIVKNLSVTYMEYDPVEVRSGEIGSLIDLAGKAADQAYAPYSGFHVGVAIEMEDGRKFMAGNQENKAYPSGICAERAGIFFVQANHPDVAVRRLLILAKQNGSITDEPVYPCGACRQVMVEAQERQATPIEIWMAGKNRVLRVETADCLLPLKFQL